MTPRSKLWTVVLVALSLAIAGCASREQASCSSDAGVPVNPVLLAFLSRARDAHHAADQYEEGKNLEGALAQLQKVVHGPVPGAGTPPPEAREVLADTWARMADLESRLGRFDQAERDVSEGLKLATRVSYFRGHLFEVRGLTEQRRAKALGEQGDDAGAGAAKAHALDAFEQSMKIQAEVIRRAVPSASAAGSASPPPPSAVAEPTVVGAKPSVSAALSAVPRAQRVLRALKPASKPVKKGDVR